MRLINAKVLYDELAKIEDSTRKEIFKHERSGAEYWMRMGALNQITKLKHFMFDSATVEAKPVIHGEWKRVGSGSLYDTYECTNCHRPPKWDCLGDNHWRIAFTDFCPNCGADMRGKKNE